MGYTLGDAKIQASPHLNSVPDFVEYIETDIIEIK
jgi:hypothetical protein